jgi:hypothetical protein
VFSVHRTYESPFPSLELLVSSKFAKINIQRRINSSPPTDYIMYPPGLNVLRFAHTVYSVLCVNINNISRLFFIELKR